MIVKLALLVVVVVLVFGLLGRWKRRGGEPPQDRIEPTRKCADCGAYLIGAHPGPCARPSCPQRGAA